MTVDLTLTTVEILTILRRDVAGRGFTLDPGAKVEVSQPSAPGAGPPSGLPSIKITFTGIQSESVGDDR